MEQNNATVESKKTSATKPSISRGKVHIKTSPVKVPQPNVETTPTIETEVVAVPQSVLVIKEPPKTTPEAAKISVSAPVETPTPLINEMRVVKLTDEDLIKRAGTDPILFLLKRNYALEEIIAFHAEQLLGLRLDQEMLLKTIANVSDIQARLDSVDLRIKDLQDGHSDTKAIMGSRERIQIRDKTTGAIYKSKNNVYQSLLKAGSLKELVDLGVFGPKPEKNSFGWYQLKRAFPDRFEEVTADAKPADIPTPEVK